MFSDLTRLQKVHVKVTELLKAFFVSTEFSLSLKGHLVGRCKSPSAGHSLFFQPVDQNAENLLVWSPSTWALKLCCGFKGQTVTLMPKTEEPAPNEKQLGEGGWIRGCAGSMKGGKVEKPRPVLNRCTNTQMVFFLVAGGIMFITFLLDEEHRSEPEPDL